jgi:hypothetical protein
MVREDFMMRILSACGVLAAAAVQETAAIKLSSAVILRIENRTPRRICVLQNFQAVAVRGITLSVPNFTETIFETPGSCMVTP